MQQAKGGEESTRPAHATRTIHCHAYRKSGIKHVERGEVICGLQRLHGKHRRAEHYPQPGELKVCLKPRLTSQVGIGSTFKPNLLVHTATFAIQTTAPVLHGHHKARTWRSIHRSRRFFSANREDRRRASCAASRCV